MIRPLLACLVLAGCLGAQDMRAVKAPEGASYSDEEMAVILELNRIRQNPKAYAAVIRDQWRDCFEGTLWKLPNHVPIRTSEGVAAVDEAIAFLENVKPCPKLTVSDTLAKAAMDHVRNQGPTGQTGHRGTDGSTSEQRIERRGVYRTVCGEIINYGPEKPRFSIIQLVIDDGVPNRGHRKAIFNPEFLLAGPAIGPHKTYGTMTVVDLADDFTPHREK
jgi:uncharacterized protein YkwD